MFVWAILHLKNDQEVCVSTVDCYVLEPDLLGAEFFLAVGGSFQYSVRLSQYGDAAVDDL